MRTFVVALTIAALALPACALAGPGGRKHRGTEQQTQGKPKVDDKAYTRALSSLPDQKYDPWKAMR